VAHGTFVDILVLWAFNVELFNLMNFIRC